MPHRVRTAISSAEEILRGLRSEVLAVAARHPHAREPKPGVGNLVSAVDTQVEAYLAEILPSLGRGPVVLGEELSYHSAGMSGATGWVVDPIDGTQNLVHGFPAFATSLGLLEQGVAVAGLVYDIDRDESFVGVFGEGATCNGKPIAPSGCGELAQALIATGRPYDPEFGPDFLAIVGEISAKAEGIRIKGPASVDICYVASGRLDGYCEIGLRPWDFAAAALIASEAGCRVGDAVGGRLGLSDATVVVSAPGVFEELARVVAGVVKQKHV